MVPILLHSSKARKKSIFVVFECCSLFLYCWRILNIVYRWIMLVFQDLGGICQWIQEHKRMRNVGKMGNICSASHQYSGKWIQPKNVQDRMVFRHWGCPDTSEASPIQTNWPQCDCIGINIHKISRKTYWISTGKWKILFPI